MLDNSTFPFLLPESFHQAFSTLLKTPNRTSSPILFSTCPHQLFYKECRSCIKSFNDLSTTFPIFPLMNLNRGFLSSSSVYILYLYSLRHIHTFSATMLQYLIVWSQQLQSFHLEGLLPSTSPNFKNRQQHYLQ